MKINRKDAIKIICLSLTVLCSILLVVFVNNKSDDNTKINVEKTENSQSILSDEAVSDLKENLGKGTNGEIVDVEKRLNEKGEDQYIFTYNDGTTQTITIKDQEGSSGIEEMEPSPQEPTPREEDPQKEKEQEEKPTENLGTVYERYINMSKNEQYAFYLTFDSHSEFVKWYDAAQAEYLKLHPKIEVGKDQIIDFGS